MTTIGVPILLLWPFIGQFDLDYWYTAIVVGILGFLTLMVAAYLPGYRSKFLPNLDAVISAHENRQQENTIRKLREQMAMQQAQLEKLQQQSEFRLQEKLSEQQTYLAGQQAGMQREFEQKLMAEKKKGHRQLAAPEKCREAQFPNFSLAPIYYVFTRITSKNSVVCAEETLRQMTNLYGVDKGSLRTQRA